MQKAKIKFSYWIIVPAYQAPIFSRSFRSAVILVLDLYNKVTLQIVWNDQSYLELGFEQLNVLDYYLTHGDRESSKSGPFLGF